jgi:hypothetical protein
VPAQSPIDARADRLVEGTVAIALLAAFVFRQPLAAPVIGLVIAIGAAFGPRANALHVAIATVVTPRLPAAVDWVDAATVRLEDALVAVLLGLASLAFLAGVDGAGWLAVLLAAGIALLAATTGYHVASVLRERLRRSRDE